jgi:MFS family permease
MLDGLKQALSIRNFWFYLLIMFIGIGIFNGVTTWVETIIRPRGFTATDAGILGALMLAGGVLGAIIIAPISDKVHRRQVFLLMGFIMAIPCVLGLAFARHAFSLFTFSFALGFFLVSVNPVGMQYATEITQPTPEGTSNGLVQLAGQLSVVFVYIMDALKTQDGSYTPALLLSVGLLAIGAIIVFQMKDPQPVVTGDTETQVVS